MADQNHTRILSLKQTLETLTRKLTPNKAVSAPFRPPPSISLEDQIRLLVVENERLKSLISASFTLARSLDLSLLDDLAQPSAESTASALELRSQLDLLGEKLLRKKSKLAAAKERATRAETELMEVSLQAKIDGLQRGRDEAGLLRQELEAARAEARVRGEKLEVVFLKC